jgi:hypothetical protein
MRKRQLIQMVYGGVLVFGLPAFAVAQTVDVEIDGASSSYVVESYSNRDGSGSVIAAGGAVTLQGDAWKSIEINHVITGNTLLEFDYQSNVEGDRQGIGFENDPFPSSNQFLKLHGIKKWGNTTFENYTPAGVVNYVIPIGAIINVGNPLVGRLYERLVFMNEEGGDGTYSNIRLYEGGSGGGDDGQHGMDGQDGQDGMDGNGILSGNGLPSDTSGDDGDFYIDLATYLFYGPKSNGSWNDVSVVSLIGPAGAPGAAGAPGEDGAPGVDGAQGAPGADGADGTPGADGAPGADGQDGAPGPQGPAGDDGALAGLECSVGQVVRVQADGSWACSESASFYQRQRTFTVTTGIAAPVAYCDAGDFLTGGMCPRTSGSNTWTVLHHRLGSHPTTGGAGFVCIWQNGNNNVTIETQIGAVAFCATSTLPGVSPPGDGDF